MSASGFVIVLFILFPGRDGRTGSSCLSRVSRFNGVWRSSVRLIQVSEINKRR